MKNFFTIIALVFSTNSPFVQEKPNPPAPTATTTNKSNEPFSLPTEEEMRKLPILKQARYRVAFFLQELPNFIVTEKITRANRSASNNLWKDQDILDVEITFRTRFGETYKLLKINNKPTSQTYESVKSTYSSGEFGGFLSTLVSGRAKVEFKEMQSEMYRNRKTVIYEYLVKKENSPHSLSANKNGPSVLTGLHGSFWIDLETAQILRIELSATDIELEFPINVCEYSVEYDWVSILNKKFWMPISSETIMGNNITKIYNRNVIKFQDYRLFETDVKIIEEK